MLHKQGHVYQSIIQPFICNAQYVCPHIMSLSSESSQSHYSPINNKSGCAAGSEPEKGVPLFCCCPPKHHSSYFIIPCCHLVRVLWSGSLTGMQDNKEMGFALYTLIFDALKESIYGAPSAMDYSDNWNQHHLLRSLPWRVLTRPSFVRRKTNFQRPPNPPRSQRCSRRRTKRKTFVRVPSDAGSLLRLVPVLLLGSLGGGWLNGAPKYVSTGRVFKSPQWSIGGWRWQGRPRRKGFRFKPTSVEHIKQQWNYYFAGDD